MSLMALSTAVRVSGLRYQCCCCLAQLYLDSKSLACLRMLRILDLCKSALHRPHTWLADLARRTKMHTTMYRNSGNNNAPRPR